MQCDQPVSHSSSSFGVSGVNVVFANVLRSNDTITAFLTVFPYTVHINCISYPGKSLLYTVLVLAHDTHGCIVLPHRINAALGPHPSSLV